MSLLRAIQYALRPPPKEYDAGWLATELQNIQRALEMACVRTTALATSQRPDDRLILVDCTAAGRTVTLMAPTAWPWFPVTFKKIDATANAMTLGGTVDGVANPAYAVPMTSVTIQSDGTALWII